MSDYKRRGDYRDRDSGSRRRVENAAEALYDENEDKVQIPLGLQFIVVVFGEARSGAFPDTLQRRASKTS